MPVYEYLSDEKSIQLLRMTLSSSVNQLQSQEGWGWYVEYGAEARD